MIKFSRGKKIKMKKLSALVLPFLVPALAFAQVDTSVSSFDDILLFVSRIINSLIPIIISLAVLVFIWGVFRYVVSSDEEAKGKGKNLMIWGIVGIFVMVSVWGLVNVLRNTFNLDTNRPDVPELPI